MLMSKWQFHKSLQNRLLPDLIGKGNEFRDFHALTFEHAIEKLSRIIGIRHYMTNELTIITFPILDEIYYVTFRMEKNNLLESFYTINIWFKTNQLIQTYATLSADYFPNYIAELAPIIKEACQLLITEQIHNN